MMRRTWALLVAATILVGCGKDGGNGSIVGEGGAGDAASGDGGTGNTISDASDSGPSGVSDGSGGTESGSGDGGTATTVNCPPLPPARGAPITVTAAQAAELHEIVDSASEGATILLEPGTYRLARRLMFAQDGVTVRSTTDNASDVILDATYTVNEAVVIQANDVTIAHVTITHAVDHPVHASPPDGNVNISGTRLYGLRIIDGGEQFVKVNANAARTAFVDNGSLECSVLELTDEGRPHVERSTGGCYTGGIDAHGARGWVIRNNHFEGIYCENEGLAEHAVHMWNGCRDTVVENNTIINCARGIGFGMGDGNASLRAYDDAPYGGASLGHYDGIIRNNVIYADIDFPSGYDSGISLEQARHPIVLHNTVVSTRPGSFYTSIDYRFSGTDALIRNNLTDRITVRNGAAGTADHNLENTPLAYFVDPGSDFHLVASATSAIDLGSLEAASGVDIDGERHAEGAPDLGADELLPRASR